MTWFLRHRRSLSLLLLVVSLTACVPYRMHRGTAVVERAGYTLSFIELDDQGELWSPSQLDSALHHIDRANRQDVGIVLALYIHGWNHDASLREETRQPSNLGGFEDLLRRIAEAEQADPAGSPREVVGVYLGWRGRRLRGALNVVSFFDRKGAATRIADAVATEVVYRMMTAAKRNPRSKCVLLGHSFGGLVLERTLGQALVAFLAAGDSAQAEFPADLVVLLNPASQAIDAKQLIDVFDRNRLRMYRIDAQGNRVERPLVVSITSVGDWATRLLYPAGLTVKSLTKSFRDYASDYCATSTSQRKYYTRAHGHHPDLISHEIEAQKVADTAVEPARRELDPVTGEENIVFGGRGIRFIIRRKARAFNETPYWIMQAPRSLLPNHSRIFGFNVFRLLGSLLFTTGALEPSSTTEIVRTEGIRPLGIVPYQDGALFLERSRRLYRIDKETGPRFHSCLPAVLDPDDDLGLTVSENIGYSAVERPRGPNRVRTEVVRFSLREDGLVIEGRQKLKSDLRFATVAFDIRGRRSYWIPKGHREIWTASLEHRRPEPRLLTRVEGASGNAAELEQLLFTEAGLFLTDQRGDLYRVDLSQARPVAVRLERLPAVPTDMVFDSAARRLLLMLPSPPTLWSLDCEQSTCSSARQLIHLEHLQRPAAMARSSDGSLWLADPAAGVVARMASSGSLEQVYGRLTPDPKD